MGTLIGLRYSPWSIKARWALDHHHVVYRYVEYLPMLGEPVLRAVARKWSGKITVPTWIDGDVTLSDSFAIAHEAERIGHGPSLGLGSAPHEVARWNHLGDELVEAGRARVVPRMLNDPAAIAEHIPAAFPRAMRGALMPLAKLGVAYVTRKYALAEADDTAFDPTFYRVLDALRAALKGGRATLLGEFSYADIAMATALQAVEPVDSAFIPLGDVTRAAWRHERMANEYRELIAWRDAIFQRYRRPQSGA